MEIVARRSRAVGTPARRARQPAGFDSSMTSSPATSQADWVRTLQRMAGNAAVTRLLVQRDDPTPAAAPAARPVPATSPEGPGREPNASEHADWDDTVPDAPWRILRAQEAGYNCFAWAVGTTAFDITSAMVEPSGASPTLDRWTTYLAETYGFGRFADGLDAGADLILYGDSRTQILHAARRADEPYQQLTFSSKLGGGSFKSPVVLHAPAALSTEIYGLPLRSFWRGAPAPAAPQVPTPAP